MDSAVASALGGSTGAGVGGAPTVWVVPPAPARADVGVRRDIAAFFGVAPRGPVRRPVAPLQPDESLAGWLAGPLQRSVAVPVDSWSAYRQRFGGFEGPGRLPYAVSAFFAQGGRRAYVVRMAHDHTLDVDGADAAAEVENRAGRASASLAGVELQAVDEGRWGDGLAVTLAFAARPLAHRKALSSAGSIVVEVGEWVPGGSVVRTRSADGALQTRFVDSSLVQPDLDGPGGHRVLTLHLPVSGVPEAVELVTGRLEVIDVGGDGLRRFERIDHVGLRADHPRWLGRALVGESSLVWPAASTADTGVVHPGWRLRRIAATPFTGGTDRWGDLVIEDVLDPDWVPGDPPGGGIHCLAEHDDVGLVVTADLYDPAPLVEPESVADPPTLAGPTFAECVDIVTAPPGESTATGLVGLRLDPGMPAELARIVAVQQALVEVAERRRDLTLLLDVPLGLDQRQVLGWRSNLDSAQAAAYHPWLDVAAPDDARDALVRIGPAAFAAGIIAERETRLGISHGPANQVAVDAVRPAVLVPPADHDALHPAGINVFLQERSGVRLTGARTLSTSRDLRQLTVARLLAVIRLSLYQQLDWVVFEPNGDRTWAEVRRLVSGFLTRLFEGGAFAGATTAESYFVRCDRTTMTRNDLDNGRLICLVGVAPSEPLEFIEVDLQLATAG